MAKANSIFDFNSKWNARFLFGAYRSDKHQLSWILKHKYYNVRASGDLFSKREGEQSSFAIPDYIFLYDCNDYSTGIRLFKYNGKHSEKTEKEMLRMDYPNPRGNYFLYGIGQEIKNIPPFYLTGIQKYLQYKHPDIDKFAPICLTGLDLLIAQNVEHFQWNGQKPLRFIDLFAGLGGFHLALKRIGEEWGIPTQCVFTSELKEDLRKQYSSNYGIPLEEINSDITLLDSDEKIRTLVPNHDILCGGFPCQPFSKAGKQQGFDDEAGRGVLFNYIANIIRIRRPKYIFLENVSNLKTHDEGNTWDTIYHRLSDPEEKGGLNYEVKDIILSPHEFGIPQHRKRIYIVGINRDYKEWIAFKEDFSFPEPINNAACDIHSIIDDQDKGEAIKPIYRQRLDVWQKFLDECNKHKAELPHAPIWAMEFGATYPYTGKAPYLLSRADLEGCNGVLGETIKGNTLEECLTHLPNYARSKRATVFPEWKQKFIRENREFYDRNKTWIDEWKKEIVGWEDSFIKFEWNCPENGKMNLEKKIIQFRPSGIRVKEPTYSPALTFMGTQVPVFPWIETSLPDGTPQKGRYMTTREAAKIQGMQDLSFDKLTTSRIYEALGNAVDVDVIKLIALKIIQNE